MSQKSFVPARPGGEIEVAPKGWHTIARDLLVAEQDRWILFVPAVFGCGVAAWFLIPAVTGRQAVAVLGLGIAVFGLAIHGRARRVIMLAGLLLTAGVIAAEVRSLSVASPRLHHRLATAEISGRVERVEHRSGGERMRVTLLRDATSIDPEARLMISFSGDVPPFVRPGAHILVPATLLPVAGPVMPGGYDPGRRAWFDGIAATGRAMGPPRLLSAASPRPGGLVFASFRKDLAEHLQKTIPGPAGAVAVALTIGEQGQVPVELVEAMRISGLVHLLTVSGFHVAIVVGGVLLVGRRLLALWPWLALRVSTRKCAAVIAGLAGTAYVLLSGADVPAVRAGITAWIVILAILMGRDPLSLRLIAFAALLILAIVPEALVNPSFQLSFAAVTSLVLLRHSKLGDWLFERRPHEAWPQRFRRYVMALLVTGMVVEVVLLPIALSHFGRAGVYGVVANMVAIPLTSLIIMPMLGLFLLASAIGAGDVVALPLGWSVGQLNSIAHLVSSWPGASVAVPMIPLHAYATGVVGALLLCLWAGRLRWLGLPLLVAGVAMAILWKQPDILIAPDGRQLAIITDDQLYTLRGHRGGFVVRSWAEASRVPIMGRVHELDGASCDDPTSCALSLGEKRPLRLFAGHVPQGGKCAAFDVVVAPRTLPDNCAPRWLGLDPPVLVKAGAVAIHADSRRIDSVGARQGDHPWSPAALPGQQMTLLGRARWIGVLVE